MEFNPHTKQDFIAKNGAVARSRSGVGINSPFIRKTLSFLLLTGFFVFAYIGISQTSAPISDPILKAEVLQAASKPVQKKVGNKIMVGIPDTVLSKETTRFISNNGIGGILLLSRNIQSEIQLKKLTHDIHTIDADIIIAIDQEGGEISRILFKGSEITPQKEIASESDAYIIARKRAEQLASYGIDMNFSPVVDFITNKNSFLFQRTFQKDPETIAALAGAMMRGYEDGGVMPVLKHFPGHTDDSDDTHLAITLVSVPKKELERHIDPFKKIISQFSTPAVMVGGTTYTAYDSVPAALSSVVIQDLLQKELGFRGIVISDDLEMDAFSNYSLEDRARRALEAGNDMIIFSQIKTTQKQLEKIIALLRQ